MTTAVGAGRANRDGQKGFTFNGLSAVGSDPQAGDFLAVMTLSTDAPPPVAISGSGMDAVVTVAGRRIQLAETRLTLQSAAD